MNDGQLYSGNLLNRHARRGIWLVTLNGASSFLLVADDFDGGDYFKAIIQLADWDGRPGMSSRTFDAEDTLCHDAEWLGEATLKLTNRLTDKRPRTHVGQVYVAEGQPYLLVLDELARLREHALVGVNCHGSATDGFYEWELYYASSVVVRHQVPVTTSGQVDSWINRWIPPADASSLSRLR